MYLIFSAVLHLLVLSSQMILAEDCSSGEKLQNSKNCQFYWECLDGRLLRQSCGSGNVFSRSRESCVALNSRHDDCTKRDATLARSTEVTTSACSVGDAYRSPDDCRIYFECQYPKYVMKRCIGSQVFSNKSRKCVNPRSEYNDCQIPPYVETTTPHCTVGEKLPNPDNSCAYFLCDSRYQLLEKQCPSGQVFNPAKKQCVTKYSAKDEFSLTYVETTTPQCTVGEKRPNPDNSCAYFLCDNRYQLQEKQCPIGQVFNPSKEKCVTKYSAKDECSPTYVETTTPHCTEGEKLPNPNNSCTYLLCDNRYQLQEKQCPSGQVFNSSKKQCVTKYSAKDECSPRTTMPTCTPGEMHPKPYNCSSYYLCDYNYKMIEKRCASGGVFSPSRLRCVQKLSEYDDCSLVTKPSLCTYGELLPKKDNCSSYFICGYNYELQEKQCETGKVFSPTRKQCVQKNGLQDDCSRGLQQMSGKSQSSYWTCDMLEAFPPPPHPPSSYLVTKPSSCSRGELLPKKDNCSSYFLCDYNYELQEKQCETGKVFSPTRKQCVQKYDLQDDCSQVKKLSACTIGEFLPKKDNCSSYFLCGYNYELQEKQCETGKVFSPARKQCVQKYGLQDDCSQVTKPSPCTYGELLPMKDNCSSYFLCGYNNELQEKQCETGKVFSPVRKQCVQKYGLQDDCSQVTKPSSCSRGEFLPKKDNCSSYFLCDYNKELQEKQCETGKVFSPTRKQCVQKYSHQDDCSQVTKSSPCTSGELLPKKDDCSSYFLCGYNNELQEKQCQTGKVFSPSRKQCVQKYGLQDDCSQVIKPSPCNPGEFLPKKENCSSYFLCGYNSELQEKQCQTGKVFSPTRKQCVQKHGLQDDCSQVTKPSFCTPDELLPKKDNCSSYFLCDYNYEPQEKQCQKGKVFSPTRKQCVQKFSVQDDCSPVSTSPLCEPGKKYSDAMNCNMYYLCRFGVRVRRICPSGQHYSVGLESCVIAYSNYDDCVIS